MWKYLRRSGEPGAVPGVDDDAEDNARTTPESAGYLLSSAGQLTMTEIDGGRRGAFVDAIWMSRRNYRSGTVPTTVPCDERNPRPEVPSRQEVPPRQKFSYMFNQ